MSSTLRKGAVSTVNLPLPGMAADVSKRIKSGGRLMALQMQSGIKLVPPQAMQGHSWTSAAGCLQSALRPCFRFHGLSD